LFCLGKFQDAVKAYENGLQLDKENSTMMDGLATSKAKLKELESTSTSGSRSSSAGPASGLGGLAGALGGMDFSSLMSNPAFMNMARYVVYRYCFDFNS